jgi:transcriptional regulator
MVYNPPAFREDDLAQLHAHIRATGFATLITIGPDGPLVSHMPLLLDADAAPHGALVGHLARANQQLSASDFTKPAVAIFMGPDAYVSPSWYPSKHEHGRVVPTWNYRVVHVRGLIDLFEDANALRAHVSALSDRHEGRFALPWQVSDAPEDFIQRQLKGIVGVRLQIAAIEGKAKLSQNRSEADRLGVVAGLTASQRSSDHEVADLMARRNAASP